MDTEPCSKCGMEMRKIGPFARVKPEGEPAAKWDGVREFCCVNEECSECGKVVRVPDES